jgi:O-antigen/teichoic acid export membrane protein
MKGIEQGMSSPAGKDRKRRGGGMASAGGSALAARVVAQIAQLAIFIFAARTLAPADFGIFALVAAVSAFLFVLGAAGWREFILAWGGSERAVNQAITYSVLSGYLLTLIGVACAAVAALIYHSPVISHLIVTLSATLLLAPVTNTLGAILVGRGEVAALSLVTIIAELAGLAAGVAGLMAGWGIVALGVSKLAMQFVSLVGVWIFARWPIKIILRGGYQRQILEISRSILETRIIGFFSANASTFIVGWFLGVASVGYYRAAERVVSAVSEILFEPLRLVIWMVFRQAADRADSPGGVRDNLARESNLIFPLLILCAAPVFIGTSIVADDLVGVLLGAQWLPAAPVVSILALGGLMMTPSIVNEPLLTINGKVNILPKVSLFNAAVMVVIFLTFTQFGLMAAAFARLGASAAVMASSFWVQVKHADAPWWGVIKNISPVYTGIVALVIVVSFAGHWLTGQDFTMSQRLGAEVAVGVVAYLAVIFLVRPSFLRTTFWL